MAYESDGSLTLNFGDKEYSVEGDLDYLGNQTRLTCTVDGVKTCANIVLNKDCIHVFTTVGQMIS